MCLKSDVAIFGIKTPAGWCSWSSQSELNEITHHTNSRAQPLLKGHHAQTGLAAGAGVNIGFAPLPSPRSGSGCNNDTCMRGLCQDVCPRAFLYGGTYDGLHPTWLSIGGVLFQLIAENDHHIKLDSFILFQHSRSHRRRTFFSTIDAS